MVGGGRLPEVTAAGLRARVSLVKLQSKSVNPIALHKPLKTNLDITRFLVGVLCCSRKIYEIM